jgi:uncharacterized DUF497 family protein
LRFQWDPKKDAINLRKHDLAFEDVVGVFDGPYLELPDERQYEREQRWIVSGEARGRVVIVVYTWRGNGRRIISARKATKAEQEEYYRAIYPSQEQ